MIVVDKALFVVLLILACIGLFWVLLILVYFVAGILDLTYYERHKRKIEENKNDCPYFIEGEDEDEIQH